MISHMLKEGSMRCRRMKKERQPRGEEAVVLNRIDISKAGRKIHER